MHKLIVIWSDGDKQEFLFQNKERALHAASNYHTAFGTQVSFTCVNPVSTWSQAEWDTAEDA